MQLGLIELIKSISFYFFVIFFRMNDSALQKTIWWGKFGYQTKNIICSPDCRAPFYRVGTMSFVTRYPTQYCQTLDLGLRLGVYFTFFWDNNNNPNDNDKNNPHLYFLKGTVLGGKERGLWIRDKRYGIRDTGQGSRDKT